MDEIIKGDKAAKEVVAVVFLRNDLLVNFLSKFILITSFNFILLQLSILSLSSIFFI